MSDDLPPIGFWSYTTSDDTSSRGKLSQLRRLLADELQQKVGRRSKVLIWQDANAIPHGATWREEIHKGIDGSSFFIPIVTPAFLESEWCCYEVMRFHALEQQRGRNDLIFPLHYVETDDFHPEEAHDPQVLTLLRARQMFDFRRLRVANPEGKAVAQALDRFTDSIKGALRVGRRAMMDPKVARSWARVQVVPVKKPEVPVIKSERPVNAGPPAAVVTTTHPAPPTLSSIPHNVSTIPPQTSPNFRSGRRSIPSEESNGEGAERTDMDDRGVVLVTNPPSAVYAIITRPSPPPPGTVHEDDSDLPEMVLLDKGSYFRGIPPQESAREGTESLDKNANLVRLVTISAPFWMARLPVTRGQYTSFIQSKNRRTAKKSWTYEPNHQDGLWIYDERPDRDWLNPGFEQTAQHPVVCVSHDDAMAYIEWINERTSPSYSSLHRVIDGPGLFNALN